MKNEFTKNKASSDSRMWKFLKLIYNGSKKTALYEIKTELFHYLNPRIKKQNSILNRVPKGSPNSDLKTRNTVIDILTIVGAALTAKLTFYQYKIPTWS